MSAPIIPAPDHAHKSRVEVQRQIRESLGLPPVPEADLRQHRDRN